MDVHVGTDGWLFLTGGTNSPLEYYTAPGFFSDARIKWVAKLEERRKRASKVCAQYFHLIVPDKIGVYPEHFHSFPITPSCCPCISLPQTLSGCSNGHALLDSLIDVFPYFHQQKTKGLQLYWKTDGHWTFEGAFSAYQVFCYKAGIEAKRALVGAPTLAAPLILDLGGKLDPPVTEVFRTKMFNIHARRKYANEIVLYKERMNMLDAVGLHVGSHVIFQNEHPSAERKRIVLFGDSFSEYRTHLLTGILAETFMETHFIWSSNIDWNYVDCVKPDIILTEMAERFMNLVPPDDLDIEDLAYRRLSAFKAGRNV